jgi:hypothetical protein
MNFCALTAQLIRARRGSRTQKALSRSLGYRSNVLFAWENGHDQPSALSFFRLVQKTGGLPALGPFMRGGGAVDLLSKQGVATFLQRLAVDRSLTELSQALDRDRYAVGRWLRGQSEVPLAEFLQIVEVTTLTLFDFLSLFVDPLLLPEAEPGYKKLLVARAAARKAPWAHAVVHLADLPSYRALPAHEPGWFARRLGVTMAEERECLQHLSESGQLIQDGPRYRRAEALTVDTRGDPEGTRRLASYWLTEGAKRVLLPDSGKFAFNTFAVSQVDLEKIKALQSEYFRKLRDIVAQSQPTEAVAVATFQLLTLGLDAPPPLATDLEPSPTPGRS